MTVRVLYLIDTLEVGGAEKSLLGILPRLGRVEPVLCHLYPGRALVGACERAGITVISLDLPGRYSFHRAIGRVRGVVRERRPDLIHSTLLRSDLVARAVGAIERIPVINAFVNDSYSSRLDRHRGRILRAKYRAMYWLDRLTASRVALFVANSRTVKDANCRMLRVPAGKVRVIYRGRDAGVFHPPVSPAAGADAGSAGGGAVSLLCVARLRDHKGIADLVHAMPTVLARCPGARLTIAGEGPARRGLEHLVARLGLGARVSLPGTSGDVAALLRAADLFVSASHAEGLPGAVVEAMLTGLPVVLSDIEVHREMTAEGATGMLFPPGDSVALSAAIVSLLERPAESKRLGLLGRERARELFDLDTIASQYEELYAQVLDPLAAAGLRGPAS